MADRKISDLTALTTPASGDYVPIVDISEGAAASKNKRVTIQSLFQGIPVNVGIGTSSPGARLQVNAPSTGRSYSSSVLDFSNIHLDGITADATTSALTFSSGGGGGAAIAFSRGGGFQTEIGFWTSSTSTANAATERLRIDPTGRVGIGTTSPSSGLHLANATAGSSANFTLSNPANNWSIRTGTTDDALVFVENQFSSEKVRITSAGNVGIGTSSPATLLDVNADTVRVRTARTPASASATGATGEICWDANYIYVCTATNTWKRSALSTW